MDGKGERLLMLHNVGSLNIPACCPMEMLGIEGTTEPIHKVRAPVTASLSQVLINGDSMLYAGSYTTIPDSWPRWSSFSGATQPTIGGAVGNTTGTLGMVSGNTGFVCLAVHGTATASGTLAADGTDDAGVAQEGRVLVRPFSSGANYKLYTSSQYQLISIANDHVRLDPAPTAESWIKSPTTIDRRISVLMNIKSGDRYYVSGDYAVLSGTGRVFISSSASSGYTDINYKPSLLASGDSTNRFDIFPLDNSRLGAISYTLVGTSYGTDRQIMEYYPTAGTWGTGLITDNYVFSGAGNSVSTEAGYRCRGPWNGGVVLPNSRTQVAHTSVSVDNKFPYHNGTSWSYIPVPRGTVQGTLKYDCIMPQQIGIAGTEVWAHSQYFEQITGSMAPSGTWGLVKYDLNSAEWSMVRPDGTVTTWSKMYSTGPGGGLCIGGQVTIPYGTTNTSGLQTFYLKNGAFTQIGNSLATLSGATMDGYVSDGDWSGTLVGDLYAILANDAHNGTTNLGCVLKLSSVGGTTHGTWETFGSIRQKLLTSVAYSPTL